MKKITIKDVAKEAGVALSTVSNALNGSELVTEETRKKVVAAAKKLNYVPNINGRLLKSGRSNRFCFVTSTIKGEYFVRLLDSVNEKCIQKGYGLDIIITWDQKAVMSRILGGAFDGFFIFEGERIKDPEMDMIKRDQIKCVMLDRQCSGESIGSVVFNSYKAGYELTRHLINLGHKKIAFVESTEDTYDSTERKRGYLAALKEYNIDIKNEYIIFGYFDEHTSYSAVMGLERTKTRGVEMPTAFVCGNDMSAIGTAKALQKIGYKIPDEISVAGFDDIEIAQYFVPALTTVKNPIEEQGQYAVDVLIDMVENGKEGKVKILDGTIVPRNSTGICVR